LVIANVKHPITSIDIDRSRNKEENMDFKFWPTRCQLIYSSLV